MKMLKGRMQLPVSQRMILGVQVRFTLPTGCASPPSRENRSGRLLSRTRDQHGTQRMNAHSRQPAFLPADNVHSMSLAAMPERPISQVWFGAKLPMWLGHQQKPAAIGFVHTPHVQVTGSPQQTKGIGVGEGTLSSPPASTSMPLHR